MTKDEAIKTLRAAMRQILARRRGWDMDYVELVGDIRYIAEQALEKTEESSISHEEQ